MCVICLFSIFKKYVYANNLAQLHYFRDQKVLKKMLSQDMIAFYAYFQTLEAKVHA